MIPMSTMAQALEPDVHRITRAEYRTLHEAGYFEDRRVELLEGVIVEMQAMGKPHILAMAWLTRHVVRGLRDGLITNPALPVAASNISQPEPDLLVVDERWPDLQGPHARERPPHLTCWTPAGWPCRWTSCSPTRCATRPEPHVRRGDHRDQLSYNTAIN